MGFYLHRTPGRLRLKIPSLKRNAGLIDELKLLLRGIDGIYSVDINSLTGSVKVNFDESRLDSAALLNLLSGEGHIDLDKLVPSKKYMDTVLKDAGRVASKALVSFAVDKAFEGSSLSIIAAFI